nr:hypothetical protein [Eubacterium sp.]
MINKVKRKWISLALSFMMIFCSFGTDVGSIISYAEEDPATPDVYVAVNGQKTLWSNPQTLHYGDEVSLTLMDSNDQAITSGVDFYTIQTGVSLDSVWMTYTEVDRWDFKPSATGESGFGYNIGFIYYYSEQDHIDVFDDTPYGFKMEKGKYSEPEDLKWSGTNATWSQVTTTTTNGAAKEGSFNYEVKLYRKNAVSTECV